MVDSNGAVVRYESDDAALAGIRWVGLDVRRMTDAQLMAVLVELRR